MSYGEKVLKIACPTLFVGVVLIGAGFYGKSGLTVAVNAIGIAIFVAGLFMVMGWTPTDGEDE